MKKRVCIDLRVCQKKSRHTGIGVYAYNLCKLIKDFNTDFELFFLVLKGYKLPFEIDVDKLIYVRRFYKPESIQELFDFIDVKYLLFKHKIDIYHSLVPCTITPTDRLKIIVTIHDIIPDIIVNERIKPHLQRIIYKLKMYATSKASRLIFDSHATKNDFLDFYKVVTNKFDVIYLGSEFENYVNLNTKSKNAFSNDYIFYIGGFNDRKNVPNLINAFLNISDKFPNLKLVIAGKPNHIQSLKIKSECGIDIFNNSKIEWKGFVPDSSIPELYSNAKFFIYPSLYEGFGLPLLEAMKLGTAIITTYLGSIPEVTGSAALYLNNTSEKELIEKMLILIENQDLRANLINQGKIQALNFSWEKTANDTISVYNQIFKDENRD